MAFVEPWLPKLHYYSLSNEDHPGFRESYLPLLLWAHMKCPKSEGEHNRLQDEEPVPLKDRRVLRTHRATFAWAQANRFQYYWNAGLRTACWESRCALIECCKKWRIARALKKKPKKKPASTKRRRKKPLTKRQLSLRRRKIAAGRSMAPIKEGRHTIFIDFCPRDIICFRFPAEHLAACVFLEWDTMLTRLPFFQLPYNSDVNLAFEFEDGWERGLGRTAESVRGCLSEASVRGLIMRLHWSWSIGKVPLWTRIYLVTSKKDIPIRPTFRRSKDHRYDFDRLYKADFNCKRKPDYYFFDGKHKFFDACAWFGTYPPNWWIKSPICDFIWKVHRFCRPQGTDDLHNRENNLPEPWDHCLRILGQVSASNDIK
ncbi:unnamed protein product [Clonostachys byssicola]|uniref:Uncharacterized protein n=1 Tax=Clonostachys byssicola TaxID=160290 RepID=A0A9N9Y527_9HYPO|nr:unnamed protein product [Clonostachys byssicola]